MCLQFSENKTASLCFKLGHEGRYSSNDSVTNRGQLGKTSQTKQKSESLVGRKIAHMFLCLGKIPDLWLRIDMERKLPSVRRSQLIWNNCHPRFYTKTLIIRSLYITIVFDLYWIKKLSKFLNNLFLCFFITWFFCMQSLLNFMHSSCETVNKRVPWWYTNENSVVAKFISFNILV